MQGFTLIRKISANEVENLVLVLELRTDLVVSQEIDIIILK